MFPSPYFLFSVFSSLLVSSSWAAASGVNGNSVVINWTEERMQRRPGETEFRPATRFGTLSIYFSSAGRPFSRLSMSTGRRSGDRDTVGNEGNVRIAVQGRTITAVQPQQGGARRLVVTLDSGFTSCTAQVIRGKEQGAKIIVSQSVLLSGVRNEIASVRTSGESCSIKSGNVFGG